MEYLRSDDPAFIPWAAGFIDGEGCLAIQRDKRRPSGGYSGSLVVGNTDPRPIVLLHKAFGGSLLQRPRPSKPIPNWRPLYCWQIGGSQLEPIIRRLLSYLVVKREEAELLSTFFEHMRDHRKGCYDAHEWQTVIAQREDMRLRLQQLKHRTYTFEPEASRKEATPETHCYRGHPLEGGNLYVYQGRRLCKTCKKECRVARNATGDERWKAKQAEKQQARMKAFQERKRTAGQMPLPSITPI